MKHMPTFPTNDIRKALHNLKPFHLLRVLTRNHWKQSFHNWEEEHRDTERYYSGQKLQRPGVFKLFLRKRVAHIHNVQDDQNDHNNQQVEHNQERREPNSRDELAKTQICKDARERWKRLPTIPYDYYCSVERERHHLEVIESCFDWQPDDGLVLSIVALVQ